MIGDLSWHTVLVVGLRVVRVLLIALLGATADEALFDGRVGEQLAGPVPGLSFKSWGAPAVVLPPVRWQSE